MKKKKEVNDKIKKLAIEISKRLKEALRDPGFKKWWDDWEELQEPKLKINEGNRSLAEIFNKIKEMETKNAVVRLRNYEKGKTFNRLGKIKINRKPNTELTPLETKLYKFCLKKGIDIMESIGFVHYEAEGRGFKNLEGKRILNRSTVGKMLKKIRPQ